MINYNYITMSDDKQPETVTETDDECENTPITFTPEFAEIMASGGITQDSFTEMANREREAYCQEYERDQQFYEQFDENQVYDETNPTSTDAFIECTHSIHAYGGPGVVTCDKCGQVQTESSGEMTTDTTVFYHNGDGNDLCETCHSTREE